MPRNVKTPDTRVDTPETKQSNIQPEAQQRTIEQMYVEAIQNGDPNEPEATLKLIAGDEQNTRVQATADQMSKGVVSRTEARGGDFRKET